MLSQAVAPRFLGLGQYCRSAKIDHLRAKLVAGKPLKRQPRSFSTRKLACKKESPLLNRPWTDYAQSGGYRIVRRIGTENVLLSTLLQFIG